MRAIMNGLHPALAPVRPSARLAVRASLPGLLVLLVIAVTGRADDRAGAQTYADKCAACHGPQGEGTADNHPDPLVGDKSVAELTELITRTMPDGAPEDCVGEEAARVAAYIHEAFYSPMAQARLQPARIELARLTVREYRNSITDLIGSFTAQDQRDEPDDDERGLQGEYYKSRRFRGSNRVLERIDPRVDFDFEKSSPDPEKIEPKEFAVRWEGAVFAPDTGDYEFIIRTKNGVRLWVNDTDTALIDGWVRSGDDVEHRESMFLLGGREYAVRLEFFKSEKDEASAIELQWKPPNHTAEVIPARCLSPGEVPERLIVETAFPPDDRSLGYERGTSISREWAQAATMAAIEVAGKVIARLDELAGVRDDASDRNDRLRDFCRTFAERAFRRPLSDEEQRVYIEQQFAEAPDAEAAVRRVVLLVLKSPRFLYREAGMGQFDAYARAAWLSYGLWDSLPDAPLLEAAARGELATREQIAAQTERMVADPRTKAKVREFLHQWLNLDRFHDVSKDAELFPGFDAALASDLRTSLDLFLQDAVWGESSDFRQLLLADSIFVNGRLAKFYGIDLPEDAEFQRVPFEPERRAGVLTHPLLLTGFAYHSTSSPIHRGVFISRSVLGRFLKPPPEAVAPLAPDLHPDLTTRQRVEIQTQATSCQTCHGLINPLGFPLEHFDAVGRFRSEDRGKPVDASGAYLSRTGERAQFNGARDLATYLAASDETHAAFVEQLFHSLLRQPVRAWGPEHLPNLKKSFVAHDFSVRRLLVVMLTDSALAVEQVLQTSTGG
jgi:mono/diheme cytochrome c family protein